MAKLTLNCFFTDTQFSFIEKRNGHNMKRLKYSSVPLEKGIIENGIIIKPVDLIKTMKDAFKTFKIKSNRVNLVLHEELFTFRKVLVPIVYRESEIRDYVKSQIGKTIMIPFENTLMDFAIHKKTTEHYEAIMFYAPESEIKQYLDVFYDLNMTVIRTDIAPLALHRLYYYRRLENPRIEFEKDMMFISVFDNMFSIYIFDQEIPVFSLVTNNVYKRDEKEEYIDKIDSEIIKIINYYKYNLNRGEKSISKVVLFNLSNGIEDEQFKQYFAGEEYGDDGIEVYVFDMKDTSKIVNTLIERDIYIPFACSIMSNRGGLK